MDSAHPPRRRRRRPLVCQCTDSRLATPGSAAVRRLLATGQRRHHRHHRHRHRHRHFLR